jgi:hypothetical protein
MPSWSPLRLTTRAAAAFLSIAAWFCLSNHCVFGTVAPSVPAESEAGGCPMHSVPAKKKSAPKPPCCKEVRAILAKCVTANPAVVRLIAAPDYATLINPPPTAATLEIAEIDPGPPGLSFAESVLQESMLSHAPPLS